MAEISDTKFSQRPFSCVAHQLAFMTTNFPAFANLTADSKAILMTRYVVVLLLVASSAKAQESSRAIPQFGRLTPGELADTPNEEAEAFKENPEVLQGFSDDEPLTQPTPATFTRSIVGPDGESAADASVCRYPNRPMVVRTLRNPTQGLGSASTPIHVEIRPQLGAGALLPASVELPIEQKQLAQISVQPGARYFIRHATGFAITAVSDTVESEIKLTPWESYSGTVKLNGKVVAGGFVQACWESLPHYEPLLAHQDLSSVPALFTMIERAAVDENGQFHFTELPSGRIKFTWYPLSPVTSEFPGVSALTWWETLPFVNRSEPDMLPVTDANLHDFTATKVTGTIEQSEAIYRARVKVDQTGETIVVGQKSMMLGFRSDHVSLDDFQQPQPIINQFPGQSEALNKLIRDAVVWGRTGGPRELESGWVSTPIDSDGQFTAFLPPATYEGILMIQIDSADTSNAFTTVGSVLQIQKEQLSVEELSLETMNVDQQLARTGSPVNRLPDLRDDGDNRFYDTQSRRDPDFSPSFGGMENDSTFAQPDDFDVPRPRDLPRQLFPGETTFQSRNPRPATSPNDRPSRDDFIDGDPVPRIQKPRETRTNEFDSQIAQLVTRLLSANDRRIRNNLRPTLKTLLEKRFDSEQKARQEIVNELKQRIEKAKTSVDRRLQEKDSIINQQLERLMGLPEDSEFDPEQNDDAKPDDAKGTLKPQARTSVFGFDDIVESSPPKASQ